MTNNMEDSFISSLGVLSRFSLVNSFLDKEVWRTIHHLVRHAYSPLMTYLQLECTMSSV